MAADLKVVRPLGIRCLEPLPYRAPPGAYGIFLRPVKSRNLGINQVMEGPGAVKAEILPKTL